MKIGLYFGSFNPITNAHLENGLNVLDYVDEVHYIVSPHNPSKDASILSDQSHRLRMVDISIRAHNRLKSSDIEFHLEKPSYTFKTLQVILQDTQNEYYFIIGSDCLNDLESWEESDWILSNVKFICFIRDNLKIKDSIYNKLQDKLICIKGSSIISSTLVRSMITQNKKINHLCPPGVDNYIEIFGLYK